MPRERNNPKVTSPFRESVNDDRDGAGSPSPATIDPHAAAAVARSRAVTRREGEAERRDQIAEQRDRAAEERDRIAAELDRKEERVAKKLGSLDDRFRATLADASTTRVRAAADRDRAAGDRERAAADRRRAAQDRTQANRELELAHLDELTGAYRRGTGDEVLRHEIQRAQRTEGSLVFAFIDIDDLKATNDHGGHAAGDELLRSVIAAVRTMLRPYDPVVRVGGDEFLCALQDTNLDEARLRFEQIEEALENGSITVGLTEMQSGDTVAEMMERSDVEMRRLRAGA